MVTLQPPKGKANRSLDKRGLLKQAVGVQDRVSAVFFAIFGFLDNIKKTDFTYCSLGIRTPNDKKNVADT